MDRGPDPADSASGGRQARHGPLRLEAERAGTKERTTQWSTRGLSPEEGRRAERLESSRSHDGDPAAGGPGDGADLAIRMDYDLDAVEDLRLAVDEACATLAQIAAGDAPLTVIFETTRAGLHIEAWVPTAEGTDVPRDGFGWAILATLVDAVDGRRATQAEVPAGDGSAHPGRPDRDGQVPARAAAGTRPDEPGTRPARTSRWPGESIAGHRRAARRRQPPARPEVRTAATRGRHRRT